MTGEQRGEKGCLLAHGGRTTILGLMEACWLAHSSRRTTRGERRPAGWLTAAGEQRLA